MERWLIEHQRLYDGDGKPTAAFWKMHAETNPTRLLPRGMAMPTVRVSETAEELIMADENAAIALGMARNLEENDRAYSHLSVTRESLYSYIASLEIRLGIERSIVKRF